MRGRHLGPPSLQLLGELRRRARDESVAKYAPQLAPLHPALLRGDAPARAALAEIAESALADMRARVREAARSEPRWVHWTAELHHVWQDTDAEEYLDDPDLDQSLRVRLLHHLDELNGILESYPSFFDAMRPLLHGAGTTRVLDLAAGHGGFALEAARIARREGLSVEVVASDLRREYLDLGERIATREGLPVRFVVQDALDLSNVAPDEYDVITCTQSLHHFPVGFAAVMLAEALRVAGSGVVFLDGCRSVAHALAIGGLCVLRWQDTALAHDAMVSFRRFYAPEELGLLAALTPLGDRAEACWIAPGHVMMRARKSADR